MKKGEGLERLLILGTSHISKDSVNSISNAFEQFNPEIVLVELDKGRLHGLMSGESGSTSPALIKSIGLAGYLFAVIGAHVQKKLGDIVSMQPGSDMLAAVQLAQKRKAKVGLIDRDIRITLKRFSKAFGAKEVFKLLWDLIRGPFQKKLQLDLRKVPEDKLVESLILQLKQRYSGMYKVLVEERNHYMAANIMQSLKVFPESRILVVVGAGHKAEINRIVSTQIKNYIKKSS